ncbi:hypothetical protein [Bythopirellula polymerisocia]|uniref:Nickel uptake substrate-specific transmembrane region n=1 Tax=Bythopirellula polymerisocia TaxID=2528003 RepID=A0A5C6CWA4_9BACT|nr:hypothetical protein [Bythopirellula polymerisocia]TWU28678.1 hypothetical protein Pla144_19700 [Bythopirellula polymerisocia]
MINSRFYRPPTLIFLGIGILVGCGDGGVEKGQVTGQITLDGKPVAGLFVTFHPQARSGELNALTRQAMGETDSEGKYNLSTKSPGDGAAVGKHRVVLVPIQQDVPMPGKLSPNFEAEVRPGVNVIDLELTRTN